MKKVNYILILVALMFISACSPTKDVTNDFILPQELCYCCKYRPLRTERERFVEAASAVFHGACINDCSGQHFADAMGAVYDAIKSGDLKAPEVE